MFSTPTGRSSLTTAQRESEVAKDLGAKVQPRSGATPWAKEDLKDKIFLYQHKEMMEGTKSHGVKRADLEELHRNAIDEDRDPCYVIEYEGTRWFMVNEDNFRSLKESKECDKDMGF